MFRNVSLTRLLAASALPAAALAFIPGAALAQDAAGVLQRAASAMGDPKSIRYAGEGTGWTYGQAYRPGTRWPKITVHSEIRTINYETASMRDEITLSRAEPKGGGGYPPVAQQKNDQFVSGDYAWNQAASGPVPGPRFVTDRVHQLWITPHGAIKAAMKNKATLKKGGKGLTAVSFTEPGRFAATEFVDKNNLVERVESRTPDPVLGETKAVTRYSDYRDYGGVKFPSRIRQSQGGFPVLDLAVNTHAHFDHAGGLRTAAAEGYTIITQAGNRAYYERAFKVPNKLNPDRLAKSGKKPRFQTVNNKLVLNDGSRSIEIHRIAASDHNAGFLMAYLPKEKLLIEADAFTPGPPNSPPPAQANPNHLSLVANLGRLKLPVDKILPLHGRVAPLADLYAAVKAPMPK